jgi:hypothetical protein
MKINLTVKENGIGFQIFDTWYGLLQSLMPNYKSPGEITVNTPYYANKIKH